MTPDIQEKFDSYPDHVRELMLGLRDLILDVASKEGAVSESLKWGEPSYASKDGTPIRIDWKEKSPEQYAMYFNCQSKMIPTVREIFGDLFEYEGTRAIVFRVDDDELPEKEVAAGCFFSIEISSGEKAAAVGYWRAGFRRVTGDM